jgi:hypothetical protein
MADLPIVIPRVVGIVGFASMGLYYVIYAKNISHRLYERTSDYKGVMRYFYPSEFCRSKRFIWTLRLGGILSLLVSIFILILTIKAGMTSR